MQKLIIENGRVRYIDLSPEEEAERLADIEANQPTPEEVARLEAIREAPLTARQWFIDNPQARLIWSMSVIDLAAEIASLVDVSFPALSAGNRLRWKLLITGIVLALRVLVKRERLD